MKSSLSILILLSATCSGQMKLCSIPINVQFVRGFYLNINNISSAPITVERLFMHGSSPFAFVEVYLANPGLPFNGIETNPQFWTSVYVGSAASGFGTPGPLVNGGIAEYVIAPGATRGLYAVSWRPSDGPSQIVEIGAAPGTVFLSDASVQVTAGPSSSGQFVVDGGTVRPRFCIEYRVGAAEADVSFSATPPTSTTIELTSWHPSAVGGLMLLSQALFAEDGTGPFFGLWPDATTFVSMSVPYAAGNVFHFQTADVGVFPDCPFVLSPAETAGLSGLSLDCVFWLRDGAARTVDVSDVVRVVFP